MKAFVPYQPIPAAAVAPPPKSHIEGTLVCDGCKNEIEMGGHHYTRSSCVAVPSKKNPNVAVSEYPADPEPDLVFHDRRCEVAYLLNEMFDEGDEEALEDVTHTIFGGPAIPCLCSNCGEDLEQVPEPLCDHCDGKMK